MKPLQRYLAILTTGCVIGSVQARTWTSADGQKTVEADFISATEDSVKVRLKGREKTFKVSFFSEADQEWVAMKLKEQKAAEATAGFSDTEFGKKLAKLHKLNGKRFKKAPLESVPKYFILYFSASW